MTFASSSSVLPSGSSKDSSSVTTHSLKSLECRPLATEMVPGLPVVQVKSVPLGTPEFEEKRAALLEAFAAKVPEELRLPLEVIQNPPTDVSSIPTTCGILSPEEIIITEGYDAVGLVEAIASRNHTAIAVARAFCKRSIIAHQLTCCLTQWFMDEAIEQAQKLDSYFETHGNPVGPLHGLPISIKDHIQVAGTSSSQGYFISISDDDQDADIVSILRAQGAIIYCKTNQPQSLMHLESDSHWGRVLNPFNIHLSAGGSTGGESALIAMKGSILGIGTDIGGSIRGPSAFCGIYGFKTTSNVLPTRGYIKGDPPPAVVNIPLSTGPMCRSLRDTDLFMKCVLSLTPYLSDPNVVPIPWTGLETRFNRRLKVGIISNDGFIEPQPPVKRAISWAMNVLSDSKDAEPLGMHTAVDLTAVHKERDDFRLAFAKSWSDQDVDVIIGPSFVGPACAHDAAFYWTYTSLYNLVDYPGAVIPTPIKAESGEVYDTGYVPLSDACRHVRDLWEEGDFGGAPEFAVIRNEMFIKFVMLRSNHRERQKCYLQRYDYCKISSKI
ncbi:amidase signature domain-containing protein [Fusarium oxysporum Fo47]|uniref:amidase signature domain-containing protein n=1 Tax=Fusarium oxysporum Fo47 TaxID=660027 RepID=UPI0028699F02|nr:amidase signature domain-containing protein [Fusarium oxysporum Fo47]QKD60616.2 amidase signature domain-containing protein [Fusarium oxysporum Fo47]